MDLFASQLCSLHLSGGTLGCACTAVSGMSLRACCGRYGVLVLVVEIMGASTVVLYGINLLFLPEAPVYQPDPARPGLPKVSTPVTARPYGLILTA